MKIAFAGCSHSTSMYGKSWANHMIDDLKCDSVDISVSGASNELLIEKLKLVLDTNEDIDFYIIQLTDPSRLTLGVCGNNPKQEHEKKNFSFDYNPNNLSNERETNNISYITIKIKQNDGDINKVINKNYKVIDFFENHVLISEFNMKIKVFHTLMTMKSLFDFYNKKYLFFSWAVDLIELSKEVGYHEIIKKINIVPSSILDFVKKNKLENYLVDSTHYSTEGHNIIYNKFLKEYIHHFINESQ